MKKTLLMLLFISAALFYARAQEINLGDFEDGVLGSWDSWGAPVGIVVNPAPDGTNSTDSVVLLDQSGGSWNGFRNWSDMPLLEGGYAKISLDVLLNADGLIQIYMDNTVSSGAANYTHQVTGITAGSWTHIEFDVSDLPAQDYKQIAFQYDKADTVYFDNIVLHVAPVKFDVMLTRETFGDDAYDTNNPVPQATGWNNGAGAYHYDWTDVTTFTSTNGHMESGSDSSIRINSYGVSGSHSGPDPSASMGVQLTLPTAYMGSWDTLQYVDIAITGEEGLKLGFAFGKRAGFGDNPDIRGLGVEVNVDDGGWVPLDTTLIPNPWAGGTKAWVEIPIELTGDTLDVRFGDYFNQCFLDDITIFSKIAQATNSFTAKNIVFGTVDSAADFSCDFNLSWDADSIYLFLDITDDSIVNNGNSYQCDNIEVYFDMDNSKTMHWPRGGGWVKAVDDAYDANDWQCRLVPGIDYSVNNGSRPSLSTGVRQVYVETGTGYQFTYNVALDSLMPGFNRNPGRLIGFDMLISDNDDAAHVNDANRNQITFVSPTDKPFNDPSLFATLQLEADGKFSLIPDTEAPSAPPDLVADTLNHQVTLTWGQSTDNIGIMSYNVLQGGTLLGNVLAKQSGVNTYKINDLDEGTYKFRVEAVDNFGNLSTRSEVQVSVVPYVFVFNPTVKEINVYPNPTTNELIISGVDNITNIEVIGLSGNVIRTFKNVSTIYVEDLTNGLYIMKIYTADDVFTGRFIKE
jgi:hypothetical protein